MRAFQIDQHPYDEDVKLFAKRTMIIKPGLTVLVGQNGAGKTTLLRMIRKQLESAGVPVYDFDSVREGKTALSRSLRAGDMYTASALFSSSEGEKVRVSIANAASEIGRFVLKDNVNAKEVWVLFDAADSGLSIDKIIELKKDLFELILSTAPEGMEVYVVASANSYEMVEGENCLDVRTGVYRTFKSYNAYRNFIVRAAEKAAKRFS